MGLSLSVLGLVISSHLLAQVPSSAPPESCVSDDQFKFARVEQKLNLDGDGKPDAVVRFEAGEGEDVFYRRGLVLNAAVKPNPSDRVAWLEACRVGGEEPDVTVTTFEKVAAGPKDLLLAREEGAGSLEVRYLAWEEGELKSKLKFTHASPDGHFVESHNAKTVKVRVTGDDGALELDGQPVDLEQKALQARCRVRELHIQLEYEWDRKARAFKEKRQGCVMGSAID